ncbi:MAG: hypothetical protein JNL61_12265 [Rhizobiaceae bacterium]|nr:hypothetical protein [Rhizobiaceae bacterium]
MVLEALDQVEHELRHLQGLLVALRALGETADSVEPIALASLGRAGCETFVSFLQAYEAAAAAARLGKNTGF